jgi:hypothetical protein
MGFTFPDGQPVEESQIAGGVSPGHELLDGIPEKNYYYTFSDPAMAARPLAGMACREPDSWRVVGRPKEVRGTTFYPISSIFGPQAHGGRITITSDTSVTKGTEVQGDLGVSLGVVEAQTHMQLDKSVTTSRTESEEYDLQPGERVHMVAQIIYQQTDLQRSAYAGPNCQPHPESATVLTPTGFAKMVVRALV